MNLFETRLFKSLNTPSALKCQRSPEEDDDDSPPPDYKPNDPDRLVPPEHDGEGHDGATVSGGRQGGDGSNN